VLDSQLDLAASGFVNGGAVEYDGSRSELRISSIFRWYNRDFDGAPGVRDFILRYLSDGATRGALESGRPLRYRYQPYDWSLNIA
jgi:hypothetical protein